MIPYEPSHEKICFCHMQTKAFAQSTFHSDKKVKASSFLIQNFNSLGSCCSCARLARTEPGRNCLKRDFLMMIPIYIVFIYVS